MQKYFEKIKERLEEEVAYQNSKADAAGKTCAFEEIPVVKAREKMAECYEHAIEIVDQVSEEYVEDDILNLAHMNVDFQKAKLEELKEIQNNIQNDGWIPCSERLPDIGDYGDYPINLVTLKNGDVCLGVYRNKDEKWMTRMSMGEQWYTSNHTVLAWQPLPAPYQPKGEK